MLMIANTCCTAASEDTILHEEKGGSGVRETKAAGYYRENRGTHSLGSRIVVSIKPRKPEEIIICVDMRQVNPAVKRKRHITPTINDIKLDLNGSRIFSKLDLNAGYHQVELGPESRNITTFTTMLVSGGTNA